MNNHKIRLLITPCQNYHNCGPEGCWDCDVNNLYDSFDDYDPCIFCIKRISMCVSCKHAQLKVIENGKEIEIKRQCEGENDVHHGKHYERCIETDNISPFIDDSGKIMFLCPEHWYDEYKQSNYCAFIEACEKDD